MTLSFTGKDQDVPGSSSAQFPGAPQVPSLGDFPPLVGAGQPRDIRGQYIGGYYSAWLGFTAWGQLPQRIQSDMREATDEALADLQEEMVAWAQQNAPWEDRTGDARNELNSPSVVDNADGSKTVILAHGVDYGIYLETMDGGAFGIIPKTIDHFMALFPGAVRTKIK